MDYKKIPQGSVLEIMDRWVSKDLNCEACLCADRTYGVGEITY